MLILVFEIYGRAVREPRVRAGRDASPALVQAVVAALVVEGVVEVEPRALTELIVGPELGGRAKVAVGDFAVDGQILSDPVSAAYAASMILFSVTGSSNRALSEDITLPETL